MLSSPAPPALRIASTHRDAVSALILCGGVLLAAGCSDGPLGPARDSLEANRELWTARGPTSYAFVYEVNCFCASPALDPVRITVESGVVTGAVRVETGEELEGEFPTVEALFERIRDAIDREAYQISAGYDPDLGYPRDVFIDYRRNTIDEEFGFLASDLEAQDGT